MWAGFTAIVKVQKANPNHDPSNGEFTSAGGGVNKVTTFTHTNGHSYTTTHASDGTPVKIIGHYTDKNGVTTSHTLWQKDGAAPSKNTASILKAGLAASGKSQSTPATVEGVYKDAAGNLLTVSMPISPVPAAVTEAFNTAYTQQDAFETYGEDQQALRSSSQQVAVADYQSSSFDLNSRLRNGYDLEDTQKTLKGLDAAMKTAIVPVDTEVTRGMYIDAAKLTGAPDLKSLVGTVFMDKGFMSTSASETIAKSFGSTTRLAFTIPKGAQGIVMPRFGWEKEIVLPRGAVLQVEKTTVSGGKTTLHCKYLGTGS